jgi:outer membrane lipoprotein carrier protein
MHFKQVLTVICLLVASLGAAAQTQPETVQAITTRVDKKYNSLQTLTADFHEQYSGAGVSRRESGTLALKRNGKMRWDFTQPRTKLFISDGKVAYFYVPEDRQVRKAQVKTLDDFHSPLRYLLGKSRLAKEFKDLRIETAEAPSQPGNVIISGVPQHLSDRVERVKLEINPRSAIQRIVITEVDGAVTEFRFSNLVENGHLADERFRFVPPKGVEVIESAELAGP